MGDALSPNIDYFPLPSEEPKDRSRLLGQSESASQALKQPWHPHPTAFDATAFDTTAVTTHKMEEETSDQPVTPGSCTPEDLNSASTKPEDDLGKSAHPARLMAYAHLCLMLEEEEKTPSASKPTCAVCSIDFTAAGSHERVTHFNECRSKYHNAAANGLCIRKRLEPTNPARRSDAQTPIINSSNANNCLANICIICESSLGPLCPVDAFEHRLFCLRRLPHMPNSCAKCGVFFVTNGNSWDAVQIVEHIHKCLVFEENEDFLEVQAAWYERQISRRDPANCACCSKSMENEGIIEAFHHRRRCLEEREFGNCPVCFATLPRISGGADLTLEALCWHVHNCQHGNSLSVIDKDKFEALNARWKGRLTAVWRMLTRAYGGGLGERKDWTSHDHRRSHKKKQKQGRKNKQGLYLTPASGLRNATVCHEEGTVRIEHYTASSLTLRVYLEKFRRCAYSVYRPEGREMFQISLNISHESAVESEDDEYSAHGSSSLGERQDCGGGKNETRRLLNHHDAQLAIEKARKAGIRVPPGFEPDEPDGRAGT